MRFICRCTLLTADASLKFRRGIEYSHACFGPLIFGRGIIFRVRLRQSKACAVARRDERVSPSGSILPPTDQSKNDQLLSFILGFSSWFFFAPIHLPRSGAPTSSELAPLKNATSGYKKTRIRLTPDPGSKRRARDSNPQPLAGYLSSSEAAHQFAYPPTWLPFLRDGSKDAMRTSLTK